MLMDDEANNSNQEANWKFNSKSPEASSTQDGEKLGEFQTPVSSNLPSVQWSASEYVDHEKDSKWYLALGGGGFVLTALIFLITQDFLASTVVFLAIISIAIFAGRKPETKQYSVDENGVTVGEKNFSYSQFRSFSVVEEGAIDSIWLKPLKRYAPAVIIYFAPDDEDKIIEVLSNFLPHEDRELDPIDRFSKRVRF